jgi:hypothetical protein
MATPTQKWHLDVVVTIFEFMTSYAAKGGTKWHATTGSSRAVMAIFLPMQMGSRIG